MDFKINARSNFSDIVKKCKNCGCTLVIKNSRDIIRKNFCSRRCNGLYGSIKILEDPARLNKFIESSRNPDSNAKKGLRGEDHPKWIGREERSCCYCESIFTCRVTSKRKYCDSRCSLQSIHKRNRGDKVEKKEHNCIVCGSLFRRSVNYKQNPKFCSYRCNGIHQCRESKKNRTDIEMMIHQILVNNNIPYSEQINIGNISVADFVVDDILIFADGDYWHNLPGRRDSDFIKTKKLESMGYRVLRFDGNFIKKYTDLVEKKIIENFYGRE